MSKLSLKFFSLIFLILFLLLSAYLYERQVYSIHFVDEEDNLVLGSYLLKGEKLYGDLFSHHQPLGYIFSASLQKITKPNTISLLIKRHREFMIAWSLVWCLILFWRFRLKALPFVFTFEPIKIFLLGNLFLSESLAVYPLVYLSLSVLEEKTSNNFLNFFWGLCFGLAAFLLSPIWPGLLILLIFYLHKSKKIYKSIGLIALGVILWILIILPFIDILKYFHDSFYINLHYYIPLTSEEPTNVAIIKGLFAPVISLFQGLNTQTGILIKALSSFFLIEIFYLFWKHRYLKGVSIILILWGFDIRYINPGQEYYTGFHLLPWLGVLTALVGALSFDLLKIKKLQILSCLVLVVPLVLSFYFSAKPLLPKRNLEKDRYINYSRQEDAASAIKIMKGEGDTLFVAPDEWLIFWGAHIDHASVMLNYYPWNGKVPELESVVDQTFLKNPPTFVYCDCSGDSLNLYKYFKNYTNLKKNGQSTDIYVLKSKTITTDKLKQLSFYNYSLKP